jgi:hypothetical protein
MRYLAIACMLLTSLSGIAADEATKPADVVAQNLDSIGTAEARAAVKSRGIQGTVNFKVLTQRGTIASSDESATADATGIWGYVSEQRKSNFVVKFGSGPWHGERFVFDGDKTSFAVFTSSHRPSSFGDFVHSHDFLLKEGLLGGELSTAWALENLDHSRAKLDYAGLKKIDGHELQCVEYASKSDDMNVKLFFDPETHHHVLTIYSLVWTPGTGHANGVHADQGQTRYTIEERFSDFQADKGLTLPHHYDLRYTQEPQTGASRAYDWDMTADKVLNNIGLDPANFQIK